MILLAALLIACAACVIGLLKITRNLDSQYEYLRWQNESEMQFAQVSVFVPKSDGLTVNGIGVFRNETAKKISEASLDMESDAKLFTDCWSCNDSMRLSSDKANGSSPVTAVGGDFFAFHPLRLLSGSYIRENDLLKDTVIVDENLAWFLFGSADVTGMEIGINNRHFYIAGVVERESDKASRKAYTGDMGLFMSWEAYTELLKEEETAREAVITCYELCMPNPVKNFASGFVQEKFPKGTGEIIENSGRFSVPRLLSVARNSSSWIISSGVPYPYWENAARFAETRAAGLLVTAFMIIFTPALGTVVMVIRKQKKSIEHFREEIAPGLREKREEAIRARQRQRWEKQHADFKEFAGYNKKDQSD